MRFYSFTNWMLRPIQQGIQPGHAAVELFVKYTDPDDVHNPTQEMLWDWARNHKTFVCLNGGNNTDIYELDRFMQSQENPYPYAPFYEDPDSLGGLMTSVGIVLSPRMYDASAALRRYRGQEPFFSENHTGWNAVVINDDNESNFYEFSDWEKEMIERLSSAGLAS